MPPESLGAEAPAAETDLPRILATDDRPEVLRLIDRTLGKRFRCEFASSVAEARRKLIEKEFELALCDIQMPGESGLVLVEEIAERHPDMAIVLVTGVDDPKVAEKTLRLGAHGYLVKPFWPGQLLITTMNALRQRDLEMAETSAQRHSPRQRRETGGALSRRTDLRPANRDR